MSQPRQRPEWMTECVHCGTKFDAPNAEAAGDRPLVPALDLEAIAAYLWWSFGDDHRKYINLSNAEKAKWIEKASGVAALLPPASPPSGTGRECQP